MAEINIKRHPFYKNYGITEDFDPCRIEPFLKLKVSQNKSGYKFFNLSNNKNQYAIGLDTFTKGIIGGDVVRQKRKFLVEGQSVTVPEYAFLTGSRVGAVEECLKDPLASLYDIRKNHFISLIKTRGGYLENLLENLRDLEGPWVEFERSF